MGGESSMHVHVHMAPRGGAFFRSRRGSVCPVREVVWESVYAGTEM